jgi:two-component system sensor histidine kinase DegS
VRVRGGARRLDGEREMALFRVTREALSNVERHAETDCAELELDFGPEALTITVTDQGRGFDAGAPRRARQSGRMGMAAMRERVDALGGRMEIQAAAGRGARITFRCPYGEDGAEQEHRGEQR